MPTRPANQSLNRSVWLRGIGGFVALIFFLAAPCWAQLPQAGDTTSPPTPGVGHDYIHSPVETVNPANGSVSIRIPIRIPESRELTIPLSIAYDSSGAFYYGQSPGGGNVPHYATVLNVPFSQGGWSYTFPLMTSSQSTWTVNPGGGQRPYLCTEDINFVFQDPTGNRHNMGLAATTPAAGDQPCGSSITSGGEGPIIATIPSNQGLNLPVTLTDGNGTVYSFSGINNPPNLPGSITDRNGNTISISGTSSSAAVTDTAGRTVVNVGTFGGSPDSINVDGLTSPYQVSWATASANFTINVAPAQGSGCTNSLSGSAKAASQIVLPNGQKYTFSYDSTYGMLNKITYPSGGYVRYVWGLNQLAESGSWTLTDPTSGQPYTIGCEYDFPAITDRYVSLDGSTEVLHQHFVYNTYWQSGGYTSKTTQVTTSFNGASFNTVYSYSPIPAPTVPDLSPNSSDNTVQMPVEQCTEYYDVSGTGGTLPSPCPNLSPGGKLLRTVVKSWANRDPRTMSSEQTTLDNNQSSLKVYCYDINEQLTETDEYDYGTTAATLPGCQNGVPSGTAGGNLVRKTVSNYATFSGAHIVDLPSSVITYGGSGNRVAETDSCYDAGANCSGSDTLLGTSVVQHVAAPGGTQRGNLTTVTKDCFVGSTTCASGNPATTYSYYDTGQINQMTDPKGNVSTFSYTDSYSSCGGNAPPSGATNAYLTQVTYPPTSGVNHVESHCYDYTPGLLRGSTDENGQTTTYSYESLLDRLSQANYPDGGQTTVSYNDTPPTPSVTVQKKLNTAGQLVTSTTITNGMGLATETELTSDPQGTDLTVTSYDGLGRASTVTNPYRSTGDPTYGVTTYAYDALSRTTSVTKPDGGAVSTAYSGNCTTVTDEAGKNRESCTDGLGRMTQVIEDTGTGHLNYVTNYTYDTLNNLLTVVQSGSRNRSFTYDSLKRLLTSQNPESGTVTYTYDANGNVTTKTDARSITTTNSYDALNRATAVTYSNSDPSVSYTYDQATCIAQSPCFNIGHRTTMTDAGGTENLSYDPMGREWGEQRKTNAVTKTTTYGYNLLGDITSLTYPSGRTITYTYDSAGRPAEAQDIANNINYAQGSCADGVDNDGVCYAPMGAVSQMQNGTNLVSTYLYNDRLQPCWFYATTGTALATSTLCTAAGSGTNATGTVSISGAEQKKCSTSAPVKATSTTSAPTIGCPIGQGYIYDSGDVSITVGGFVADASYGQGSTSTSIANALTSSLNSSNSPVTATLSGTTITLTSKATGASANYSLSTSVSWDNADFSGPSFHATPSGSTLTGGSGGIPGNILDLSYNFNLGSGDNGNVMGITNDRDTTRTQSFTYDNLNRITTGKTSSTSGSNCWGESFQYDNQTTGGAWGNLTAIGAVSGYTGCTQESLSVSATANNQLSSTGYSYDLSGNMQTDGANTYAYNAESEIKSAAGVNYTYDGDGNRVYKSNGKIYWYGAGTEILDESDGSGNLTNEYVFFGGKRVAMRTVSSGTIYYYEEDMLGSSRTIVQAGQTTPCYDADFTPFGGERGGTNTCSQNYKFEGKERDTESGNDDFGARYYSSRLGRWLSADWSSVPVPVPYANLSNPQTLNLYAMVSDNPETFADLDGHACGGHFEPGTFPTCESEYKNDGPSTAGEGFPNPGDGLSQSTTQQAILNVVIYRSDNLSTIGQEAVDKQLSDLKKSMATLGIKVNVVRDVTENIGDALKGKGLQKGAFNIIAGTGLELGNKSSGSGFSPSLSNPQYTGAVINEFKNVGNPSVMTHEVLHGLNRDWTSANPNSFRREVRAHWDAFLLRNGISWGMSKLKNRLQDVQY